MDDHGLFEMIALLAFAAAVVDTPRTIALQLEGQIYYCAPSTAPKSQPEMDYAKGLPIYEDRFCQRVSPAPPPDPVWTDGLTEQQLSKIEEIVCGPEGANDSIDNGTYACNRGGWNGHRYVTNRER